MKPTRVMLTGMLAALFMQPVTALAEDIDIYSGLGVTGNVPNVLIVMDNAANFSSSSAGATCVIDAAPTALSGSVGGIEQCALYNVIKSLPTKADGSALVNIGMMVYNANNIRDVNNLNCGASSSTGGCLAQPLIPMDVSHKTGLLNWIKSWKTTAGTGDGYIKASGGATAVTMQEAWAYYSGGTGVSGRDYSGIKPASGCQKNFVIFIGNSYSSSGTPGDPPNDPSTYLTSAVSSLTQPSSLTTAQWTAKKDGWKTQILDTVTTSCPSGPGGSTSYTFPSTAHDTKGYYADEWARFMNEADLYGTPDGTQAITTYSIGLLGASCQAEYAATLINMATYGGGKYFPTSDYNGLVVAILKILNEVQAVNSVFASSSLPVSVNAQGTYLNQIYMGMFRPDPGALPRWVGNLKQYKFIINSATGSLQLGDSIGEPAISSSGTGFLSPNAISYWTCSRSDNPYLSSLNAGQNSKLASQGQICASDPVGGFWKNFSSMTNSAGKGFDLADGELVEKGAVAQRIRLDNLTDDYAANPSTPRKLYTYCPSGASCNADLTNSNNAFATSNTGITAAMFGSAISVNIATLTRSGTTATATTIGNHGFAAGDSITIANASQSQYNGTHTINVLDATHFTYTVVEYPPTPAVGTYQASIAATPKSVTITRSGNTVTATSPAHGFNNGDTVIISGADQPEYNGSFVIGGVATNTFTYSVTEKPLAAAPGASATAIGEKNATGTCPAPCMVSFAIGSITRSGTTVTVNTAVNNNFIPTVGKEISLSNVVDAAGVAIPEYNGNVVTTSWNSPTNNRSVTFTVATSPATPATGTITASTPSAIKTITSLTRSGNTVTATSLGHGYSTTDLTAPSPVKISIGAVGVQAAYEEPYVGTFAITKIDNNTFTYQITTTPASPATGVGGSSITATRSTGFATSDRNNLINWVRGEDNFGDETGPGGGVTIRPSVHGDVLHSRPTVLNYGGAIINITGTSDSGSTRTATASATDVAKIGATGAIVNVKFDTGHFCKVTVASSTTFTYPTTNCGNTGAQSVVSDKANIVVFYGDNSGVFHAINGNQVNPPGSSLPAPGTELWGFIPSEHFIKLNRLRVNSPQLNLPSTPPGILPAPTKKNYFVDGPTGVYQLLDAQGTTLKAYLYLSMRRGGQMVYALDVTDPQTPRFLWKVDNTTTNMSELGQTWSMPKVAKVKGHSNPVLIFGAGYDPNQDVDPPTALDSMGRGIFVLDAITGSVVWRAIWSSTNPCPSAGVSGTTFTSCTTPPTVYSDKMTHSIPTDITLMDRNNDGYIDRLYAADTGGLVWRIDTEPSGNTAPSSWKLHRLAKLGNCGSLGTSVCRKFFYPPEVINTSSYDAVIVGSGDREHPLYNNTAATGKQNIVFLLKDTYTGNDATGMTRIEHVSNTETDLCNATSVTSAECTSCLTSQRGYYINLLDGEKVVNAPLVTAGYVYFGTNKPVAPSASSCVANLGEARGYRLSPFTCEYSSVVFAGGGLPPSPVSGVVNIEKADGTTIQAPFIIGGANPDCSGADCASALGGQKPVINVSTRRNRTYWYKEGK